ncbi:MAG: hypothetical protein KGL39_59550 [Patescibacteria group bacterium]|nr:hypothetical protein [Patescibacteria group bacterium]
MTLSAFVRAAGSHDAAAQKIGVTRMTLWRWLRGRAKPGWDETQRLARLGVTKLS